MALPRLTFRDMATLALGTPESPNFKVLRNLMAAMIRKLNIEDVDANILPTATSEDKEEKEKMEVRIQALESQLNKLTSEMESLKKAQPDISQLQKQLAALEKNVTMKMAAMEEKWKNDQKDLDKRLNAISEVMDKASKVPSPPRSPPSSVQGSREAAEEASNKKMNALQSATDNLTKAMLDLQKKLDAMMREMNLLKEDTLNDISKRLEKFELMAREQQANIELNKEDMKSIESKVSQSSFDATTEQLNEMIQDLLSKMSGQEANWNTILEQLNAEMKNKMDRMELNALNEKLEKRWNEIRKQLKDRPPQYEADEAAAIRKQLIAKFNCLSCDRQLLMKVPGKPPMNIPRLPEMPPQAILSPMSPVQVPKICQRDNQSYGGSYGGNRTAAQLQKRYNKLEKEAISTTNRNVVHLERPYIRGTDGQNYYGRKDNDFTAIDTTYGIAQVTGKKLHKHRRYNPPKK